MHGRAARPTGWCSGPPPGWGTWPCSSARPPAGTGSAGSACWPRPASGAATPTAEAAKRPSVQVGDPYEEKRLIEACLELLDAKLVVGIQDLGGAGLVCATSETAARGGVGMDVDVSAVPRREPGMAPYEVMTSESQERMLAIVTPERPDPGGRGLPPLGGALGRGGPGHRCPDGAARAAAHPRRLRRRGPRRRARRRPQRRRPPLPPAPGPAGRPRGPGGQRPRRAAGADRLRAPTSWPCWPIRRGSTASTTTSSSSTRSTVPAGTPPCSGWPPRACRPRPRGWPSPPTPTPPGAPSTPGPGTAATVAEGALNVACAGARPDGRGQLPQLRQPRAPRGHVAAVRGHRRHE